MVNLKAEIDMSLRRFGYSKWSIFFVIAVLSREETRRGRLPPAIRLWQRPHRPSVTLGHFIRVVHHFVDPVFEELVKEFHELRDCLELPGLVVGRVGVSPPYQ